MFTVFLEHKLLSGIFIILLSAGIVCQLIIGGIYRKLITETDNMSSTGNKFLKQCKMKFANCYQLGGGVPNIPVFVDKFLAKISFMGISLTGIQHLAGQLMLLSVAAAGVGACREIVQGETVGKVLPYYIVSFLALYVYFSMSGMVDIQGKRERLKTNLVDYLENHMVNKLKQSAADWEGLTGEKTITRREPGTLQEEKNAAERVKSLREGRDAAESVKSLREGRDAAESAKSLRGGRDAAESTGALRGGRDAAESAGALREKIGLAPVRQEKREEGGSVTEEEEEKRAVFSRQEEKELEELLREFLV